MRSSNRNDPCGCERLRLVGAEVADDHSLRWRFWLSDPASPDVGMTLCVTTSRDGNVYDVQHGADAAARWLDRSAGIGWPPGEPDLPTKVGERIREELARVELARVLSRPAESRWAA